MNATRLFVTGIAMTALIVGTACAGDEASDTKRVKEGSVTMENLQKAFNGESNAKARYEAFAKKADEEGYLGVAGLFRAAAKAEALHAKKYEKLIGKLGGTAKLVAVTPEAKSTKENLQAAIAGETDETTNMYVVFAAQAEAEKNTEVARAFRGTAKVEGTHAAIYTATLAKMEELKAKTDYALCTVCGLVATAAEEMKKCPVCSESRKKFEIVN